MQDEESVFKGCAGAHGGDRGFLPGERAGYGILEQSRRPHEEYGWQDGGGDCVDFEAIKRVLEAGMKAPSWDHYRNWQFGAW